MNNRQAGRRRGRGGQRSQGNPNSNSRIDNRQRGNASQLYEKYKNLARDAQMGGDRVNTEYYLQFADHYFRVLNENRSRFEENRRQREEAEADDDTDTDDDGDDRRSYAQHRERDEQRLNGHANAHGNARSHQEEEDEAPRRQRTRAPRNGGDNQPAEEPAREADAAVAEAAPPRRRGRPRKNAEPAAAEPTGLDADRLPPSLGVSANGEAGGDAGEEKPRRRRGRPAAAEATAADPRS